MYSCSAFSFKENIAETAKYSLPSTSSDDTNMTLHRPMANNKIKKIMTKFAVRKSDILSIAFWDVERSFDRSHVTHPDSSQSKTKPELLHLKSKLP